MKCDYLTETISGHAVTNIWVCNLPSMSGNFTIKIDSNEIVSSITILTIIFVNFIPLAFLYPKYKIAKLCLGPFPSQKILALLYFANIIVCVLTS